jgi:hypothetical protein
MAKNDEPTDVAPPETVVASQCCAMLLRELLPYNNSEKLDPLVKTALRDATIAALNKAKALSDEL